MQRAHSGVSYPFLMGNSEDEMAVDRYRYLLRTAPPEAIEQVHAEAFTKLTQEQRDLLFKELWGTALTGEAPRDATPSALATAATRQELREPGTMERSFGGGGFGSMLAGSLLGTVAGYVIGSAIVSALLPDASARADGSDATADSADSADAGDGGGDFGGDFGGGDFGGDFGF